MTEEEALLDTIRNDPDDDTVRLAYADWLQEHDEDERAAFIRAGIRVHQRNPSFVYRFALPNVADSADPDKRLLFDLVGKGVWKPLSKLLPHKYYETAAKYWVGVTRGFVSELTLPLTQFYGPSTCKMCDGRGHVFTQPHPDFDENQYACAGCGRVSGMYGHQGQCPKETCPVCRGSKTVDGIAAYVHALPVTRVNVMDRNPSNPGNGFSWYQCNTNWWFHNTGDEYWIPDAIYKFLRVGAQETIGGVETRTYWGTRTDKEALRLSTTDLSDACCRYLRDLYLKRRAAGVTI